MTAPVQEPNLYRSVSGLSWGQNQLFRRPPPRGAALPVAFRGRQVTGGFQTLGASGAETELTWNSWENCDESVFEPELSGGLVRTVDLQQDGVYSIMWTISVQTLGSAAGSQLVMIINDGFDSPTMTVHMKQTAGAGGDYLQAGTWTYPPFNSAGGSPAISFDAAQSGGTDRDTGFGTYFEIVYYGPFECEPTS